MPKVKKPAPKKGGEKKAAPKKKARKSVTKLTERQADQLAADKMRADSFASTQPKHPTVEEQHTAGYSYIVMGENEMTQNTGTPAWVEEDVPPKPAKRGWWTRYQSSETGRFISAVKALADKAKSFGRRVLRKPSP